MVGGAGWGAVVVVVEVVVVEVEVEVEVVDLVGVVVVVVATTIGGTGRGRCACAGATDCRVASMATMATRVATDRSLVLCVRITLKSAPMLAPDVVVCVVDLAAGPIDTGHR